MDDWDFWAFEESEERDKRRIRDRVTAKLIDEEAERLHGQFVAACAPSLLCVLWNAWLEDWAPFRDRLLLELGGGRDMPRAMRLRLEAHQQTLRAFDALHRVSDAIWVAGSARTRLSALVVAMASGRLATEHIGALKEIPAVRRTYPTYEPESDLSRADRAMGEAVKAMKGFPVPPPVPS